MNRVCLVRDVVYEVKVISVGETKYCISAVKDESKRWYYNYKRSMSNSKYKGSALHSNYYWNVIDNGKEMSTITRKVLAKSRHYNWAGKGCNLYLTERLIILQWMDAQLLNKRSKLMATCWHKNKYLIKIHIRGKSYLHS